MKLFIKNMVCNRCIMAVKQAAITAGLTVKNVTLGELEVEEEHVREEQRTELESILTRIGFELIDDRKSRIIERIKNTVIEIVHYNDDAPVQKHSELLAAKLHHDYQYLSKLFSSVEGITIEQYIITQKVEKIKEYIVYDELTLSEIADRMGYSSVAHLSAQFKKVTGLTPSHFKKPGKQDRKPLDAVGKAPQLKKPK